MISKLKNIRFSGVVLMFSLVLVGGFNEYISCTLSAAMLVYLLIKMQRNGALSIPTGLQFFTIAALAAAYGWTCLWAIDPGMGFIGFLKFLPLPLYLICLAQEEKPLDATKALPWLAIAMALISAVGMQFEAAAPLFSVASRLSGLFQYPNTFAIFLLICQLLVLKKEQKKLTDYLLMTALIAALLYTGSRAVFVIGILSNIVMLLLQAKRKMRIVILILLGVVAAAGGLLALDENSVLHRYLTISLTESTFVGRILYMADALPLLLKYPLGMGYMGYAYIQNSIQTGVYTVAYIHNDLLQFLLDVGLIPGGLFIGFILSQFFRRDIPAADKVILGAFTLHSMFDFNLQYIGIFLVLLLLTYPAKGKTFTLKTGIALKAVSAAVCVVCLYMGSALCLAHFGQREAADGLYPFNTQNKLQMLSEEVSLDKANQIAGEILSYNTHYFAPYSVKAKFAFSQGDITSAINHKRTVFSLNPFNHTEYEEYCQMLIHSIKLFSQAGDSGSVAFCKQELLATRDLLSANAKRLSSLGKMINDQPVTELSQEVQNYIRSLEVNANG